MKETKYKLEEENERRKKQIDKDEIREKRRVKVKRKDRKSN